MFRLRPLDFGEILDRSFRLYFRSWKPLTLVALMAAVPSIIVTGLSQSAMAVAADASSSSLLLRTIIGAEQGNWASIAALIGAVAMGVLAILLVYPLAVGTLIAMTARQYLNQPVTVREALMIGARTYLALLGTGLLTALLILAPVGGIVFLFIWLAPVDPTAAGILAVGIAGLMMLILLPLYVGSMTYLVFSGHAVVVEGVGGGIPAMARSVRLVRGRFWPLLGLGVVFSLLGSVISGIVQMPLVMPLAFVQAVYYEQSVLISWIIAVLTGVSSAVVFPLPLVGMTLAYYDTRVRKEGLDLEMMAQRPNPGPAES